LILGCTHYPLLKEAIRQYMGEVTLIDPSEETSLEIREILQESSMLNNTMNVFNKIFVTDSPVNFMDLSKRFLGTDIFVVEKINLEEYKPEKVEVPATKVIQRKIYA